MAHSKESRAALRALRVAVGWEEPPRCLQAWWAEAYAIAAYEQSAPGLEPKAHPFVVVVVDGPPDDPASVRLVIRTTKRSWQGRRMSPARVVEVPAVGRAEGATAYLPFEDVPRPPVPIDGLDADFDRERGRPYDLACELRGKLQAALDAAPREWRPVRQLWHQGGCPP